MLSGDRVVFRKGLFGAKRTGSFVKNVGDDFVLVLDVDSHKFVRVPKKKLELEEE